MSLSDLTCRTTKPGPRRSKLSDGGGLQLWIMPNGSRLWRLVYSYGGKQKAISFGTYPEVSLTEARDRRAASRLLLREGRDPQLERQRTLRAEQERLNAQDKFGKVVSEFMEKCRRDGLSESTLVKKEWMFGLALPKLKDIPISELRPLDVLGVLKDVEKKGLYETATTLRANIGQVCRYAIFTARAHTDPTAVLRGALITPKVKSYAAITDPQKFGALLQAIDGFACRPQTIAALQLLALLFPRPGEMRQALWPEFDLEKSTWTIPACRMKGRIEHKVPLARQSIRILHKLRTHTGHRDYVFPGLWAESEKSLCENTLNKALRRMGYGKDEMTSHGFRSSASSMLNESGLWSPDAIERQLAHVEANPVRRVYARNTHWKVRVEMMQWWADYLDRLRAGDVRIGASV